jgi:hypothetical protein
MGASHSQLLYQIPDPPGYDDKLEGLIWIEDNGMKIPAVFLEVSAESKK